MLFRSTTVDLGAPLQPSLTIRDRINKGGVVGTRVLVSGPWISRGASGAMQAGFGGVNISRPDLQLPHPRMFARRFVLEPLAEIRPDLVLPEQTKTVAQLLAELPNRTPLVQFASRW